MKKISSPLVSIIIPNKDCEKELQECVYTILKSTWKNIEIIIVDNYSSKQTVKTIKNIRSKYNQIKVIFNNHNNYFAQAVNQGFESCDGKYILILNNDVVLENNTIENLVRDLESDISIAAVHPQIISIPDKKIDNLGGVQNILGFSFKDIDINTNSKNLFYVGIGLYRRSLLEKNWSI